MNDADNYKRELEAIFQEAEARDERATQLKNGDLIQDLVDRAAKRKVSIDDLIAMADQGYGLAQMESYISGL